MSEQIRREFNLPFPLVKIKAAIEDACRINNTKYLNKERNRAFNSYSISLIKNLYALASTVTISAISETETRFEFSAIPGPQLTRLPHITSASIDGFLKDVGDFASGKLVVRPPTAEDVAKQRKAGKTILLLMLLGVLFAAVVLYFAIK